MSVMASPLEPLAFDFVSLGIHAFVNNLWAWIAVITAAVSFWRVKAAGGSTPPPPSSSFLDETSIRNVPSPAPATSSSTNTAAPAAVEEHESPMTAPVAAASPAVTCRSGEDEGVLTKGHKFRVYYENDPQEADAGSDELAAEQLAYVEGGDWWASWDRVLKMRSGEMGWYLYQDLADINGNVVRLWDASSCIISPLHG